MRALQIVSLACGGCLGFWRGNTNDLLEDIRVLRITAFFLVPRIVEKIIEGIRSKVERAGRFKQNLFAKAFKQREEFLQCRKDDYNKALLRVYNGEADVSSLENYEYNNFVSYCRLKRFDYPGSTNIVFGQFPRLLGGRCRLAVTGSAPLSEADGEFFVICFNLHLFEGFGMSETAAHGGVQSIFTLNYGSIGESLDSQTRLRIQSVPEMGYTIEDSRRFEFAGVEVEARCPRGELLIKGPSVFKGYYNDARKTEESFHDGWFATGDIAEYNPVTREVRLIDRKRGIIKLSEGEYISISQVEDAIATSCYVEQVFLYANRFYSAVVCVIVPNMQFVRSANNYTAGPEAVAEDRSMLITILTDVRRVCREAHLRGFEIPKVCIVESEEWTPENGMLTPTMKIRRHNCKTRYEPLCIEYLDHLAKLESATPEQCVDILLKIQSGELRQKSHYEGASELNYSE